MITMEYIKDKLGFDPVEYLSTPEPHVDSYAVDDSTPSVFSVLNYDEKEWLLERLITLGVF